jgi:hypothetical protein
MTMRLNSLREPGKSHGYILRLSRCEADYGEDNKRAAGLLVGPPRNGCYMFSGVESARKQVAVILPHDKPKKR